MKRKYKRKGQVNEDGNHLAVEFEGEVNVNDICFGCTKLNINLSTIRVVIVITSFILRITASENITTVGAPRVPPLNPSETILF